MFDCKVEEFEANLAKFIDYQSFKKATVSSIANKTELQKAWQIFCIEEAKSCYNWNASERLMLLKVAFACLKNFELKQNLAQFLKSACDLRRQVGIQFYLAIFNSKLNIEQCHFDLYSSICKLVIEMKDQPQLLEFFKKNNRDLMELSFQLEAKQAELIQSKLPKRSTDELIQVFGTKNELVKFPLSSEELNILREHYTQFLKSSEQLKRLSSHQLKEQSISLGLEYQKTNSLIVRCQLISVICEAIYHVYKIRPYDTQVFAILALLHAPEKMKGRISQIKTGEGKSTIITILSAFHAAMGDFVDVVTSSSYLAIRDCKKYEKFYSLLGLTCSHISMPNPRKENFHGQILYGKNTDFEWAYLGDGLNKTKKRMSQRNGILQPRSFDTTIIDEVDNLFLDEGLQSAIISIPSKEQITWIYPLIFNIVISKPDIEAEELRKLLLVLRREDRALITSLPQKRFHRWIQSVKQSFKFEHGKDYYVRKIRNEHDPNSKEEDTITIVATNSGRFAIGCQWQEGRHQFIQVKHSIAATPENLSAASISHPTFFGLYKRMLALTGTMGESIERHEIETIYQVGCFDVPPHLPSQRKTYPPQFFIDTNQHYVAIMQSIKKMQSLHRPCLVLFKTINQSNAFSKYLVSLDMKHLLLNETQRESEDYIVARAGDPGAITVATNTAGRGTDIECAQESLIAGGLHVIFTFYADNSRVQGQGDGRAGRQGQDGSCEQILCLEDDYISLLLSSLKKLKSEEIIGIINYSQTNPQEFLELLNSIRTVKIQETSNQRSFGAECEKIYFEKLQFYFSKINLLYQTFESEIFKGIFIDLCKKTKIIKLSNIKDEWRELADSVQKLIAKKEQSAAVNWDAFYERFQQIYMENFKLLWAEYYTQLHEKSDSELIRVKRKADFLFRKIETNFNEYCANPVENILKKLLLMLVGNLESVVVQAYSKEFIKLTHQSNNCDLIQETLSSTANVLAQLNSSGDLTSETFDEKNATRISSNEDTIIPVVASSDSLKNNSIDSKYTLPLERNDISEISLDAEFEQAIFSYKDLNYHEAILKLNRIINIDPNCAKAHKLRGRCYSFSGQTQLALDSYDRAIKLNPNDADIFYYRSFVYKKLDDYWHCLNDLEKYMKMKGDNIWIRDWYEQVKQKYRHLVQFHLEKANSFYQNHNYNMALAEANEVINRDPDCAEAHKLRGKCYYFSGQTQPALESYNLAIKLNPNDAFTFIYRAYAFNKLNDYEHCLQDIEKHLQMNSKATQKTRDWYERIKKEQSMYLEQKLKQANSFYKDRNYDMALTKTNEVLNEDPNFANAHKLNADCFYESGQFQQAITSYNRAIELNPYDANTFFRRAYAFEKLGDQENCSKDIEKYMQLKLNHLETSTNRIDETEPESLSRFALK